MPKSSPRAAIAVIAPFRRAPITSADRAGPADAAANATSRTGFLPKLSLRVPPIGAATSSTSADMRRVTIAQCIRLFFLVAALPTVITWLRPAGEVALTLSQIGGWQDILLLVAVSTAAGYALEWMKVPAGLMLGPMLASAALELSGLIQGTAPASILIPANVVLGVMIGARFSHFTFREFREALVEGFSAQSLETVRMDRPALDSYLASEARKWAGVVQQTGAKVD